MEVRQPLTWGRAPVTWKGEPLTVDEAAWDETIARVRRSLERITSCLKEPTATTSTPATQGSA